MTVEELAYEIGTKAPSEAQPFADIIAQAAFTNWPQDPRMFAWLTVAIGERESHWKNVRGADGHGCGYMQIDDRAWKEWCSAHDAFDASQNIPEGEVILAAGLRRFAPLLCAGIAAYNCGPGNVIKGMNQHPGNVDAFTTGGDYSRWVINKFNAIKPVDLAAIAC